MLRARVLLADDHRLVAEAFRKLVEPHYEVVGIVADGRALVAAARTLKPDVIVVDVAMPLLNGLEATEQLRQISPKSKIIIVTMEEDSSVAADAIRRGASGYLLKTAAASELLKAIQDVLKSKSYVTPQIAQGMMDSWVRDPRQGQAKHLTQRQREVIQLLAEGRTMKQVAAILSITPRTVAFHKYKIMEDFGLKSNAELFQFAVRERMITAR